MRADPSLIHENLDTGSPFEDICNTPIESCQWGKSEIHWAHCMDELPKAYEPQKYEDDIYRRWEESGFFNPDNLVETNHSRLSLFVRLGLEEQSGKDQALNSRLSLVNCWRRLVSKLLSTHHSPHPFTIVMPPPNVTGTLHVGHAVMLALEDIMIRFARMRGERALWIPGTDHAAIATQAVVEKKLIKEGIADPRRALGREVFLKKVEEFAAASHDRIVTQIKKMGASCDWSRESYTLDVPRSLAVRTMFKKMYDDGLIYRGNRIVNWCPRCKSTLADDEVEYREEKTPFYYFKYGPVVIGTARPETKFADKTLVVHPDDERYQKLIGTEFEIEWIEGKIKANVIADSIIDRTFGTGAMTITPAHSFEDFDLAQKYKLPVVKIIDEDGNLTDAAGAFAGRHARDARIDIVKQLADKGLVDHIDENYVHNLSICYRCGAAVEPLPKLQWFIDVNKKVRGKTLKERMREAVAGGGVTIIPERFEKTYFHWIDNLRDWCISRQIWFGHRIPVWYRVRPPVMVNETKHHEESHREILHFVQDDREVYVGLEPPLGDGWIQDEDTLDTWFSAGLWTFSTLGWPSSTRDLETYHPTAVLETGYDILFFWIARMIMMTTYALDEVPFKTVYLHGLVRDEQGRKMSKSLGNVIDPLDMTQKYGADATRLSLVLGTAPGNDVKLSEAKIAGYRNFTNKLWNIARFILTTAPSPPSLSLEGRGDGECGLKLQTLADRWILAELDRVTREATEHLLKYEFSPAGELLRDFTWNSFADWYLEIAKCQMLDIKCRTFTQMILRHCLDQVLRLWHPFTPFVTEVLWREMGQKDMLMVAQWPEERGRKDEEAMVRFEKVQGVVTVVRSMRADYGIPPAKKVEVVVSAGRDVMWLTGEAEVIKNLARIESLTIIDSCARPPESVTTIIGGIEISMILAGLIDAEKERGRLKEAIEETSAYVSDLEARLGDEDFVSRAPSAIIEEQRTKLADAKEKLSKLEDTLSVILNEA